MGLILIYLLNLEENLFRLQVHRFAGHYSQSLPLYCLTYYVRQTLMLPKLALLEVLRHLEEHKLNYYHYLIF